MFFGLSVVYEREKRRGPLVGYIYIFDGTKYKSSLSLHLIYIYMRRLCSLIFNICVCVFVDFFSSKPLICIFNLYAFLLV